MTKLYAFMAMLCLFVIVFVWHVQSLQCEDGAGFDVACHKMYMSFGVLFCIGILILAAAGFYILYEPPAGTSEAAKNVFDSFAKQLIPIATLVLGYYFGTTGSAPPPAGNAADKPTLRAPAASAASAASATSSMPERK